LRKQGIEPAVAVCCSLKQHAVFLAISKAVQCCCYIQLLTALAGVISSVSDSFACILIGMHCLKIQCSVFSASSLLALEL